MLVGKNMMTGTLIMVIGVIFFFFVLLKLIPKMKAEVDGRFLSRLYLIVSLGITCMGGWIFFS
ncbi:hypothetical protein [Levilactobacillus acidifarinae]|uniref:Uncharacterized protein n=1 Tax=Levilactobacillus acidifarinae DSM 19394 = JCM 15949 TaxID=1423715 RepID=A0A0R1LE53_9LACO|nr:hypothetical protein [Levilactobacillus acidifarinae]KRK93887.1 hypothetical protein FD25_GL001214 [Levilactobacillus acidifarinae DSM 19394]GEO68775.1 hypothetical protein LAC03_06850 [Levilactobacillus acidifarinae]